MSGSDFIMMRTGLVQRGLLSTGFHLTPAGHAYCADLIAELFETEAVSDPDGPRVRWNTEGRLGT